VFFGWPDEIVDHDALSGGDGDDTLEGGADDDQI
jgi:Ca2+-binding RTX toxin-like protein